MAKRAAPVPETETDESALIEAIASVLRAGPQTLKQICLALEAKGLLPQEVDPGARVAITVGGTKDRFERLSNGLGQYQLVLTTAEKDALIESEFGEVDAAEDPFEASEPTVEEEPAVEVAIDPYPEHVVVTPEVAAMVEQPSAASSDALEVGSRLTLPLERLHPNAINAALFPSTLSPEGLQPLVESLRDFGQRDPIVVDPSGTILNGERRYRALPLAGFTTADVVVVPSMTLDELRRYTIDCYSSQRAAPLSERVGLLQLAIDLDGYPKDEARKAVAARCGFTSWTSAHRALTVWSKGGAKLRAAVEKGEISLFEAAEKLTKKAKKQPEKPSKSIETSVETTEETPSETAPDTTPTPDNPSAAPPATTEYIQAATVLDALGVVLPHLGGLAVDLLQGLASLVESLLQGRSSVEVLAELEILCRLRVDHYRQLSASVLAPDPIGITSAAQDPNGIVEDDEQDDDTSDVEDEDDSDPHAVTDELDDQEDDDVDAVLAAAGVSTSGEPSTDTSEDDETDPYAALDEIEDANGDEEHESDDEPSEKISDEEMAEILAGID